jgi:hypothetical protein
MEEQRPVARRASVDRAAAVELQHAAREAATFIRLWRSEIAARSGTVPGSAPTDSSREATRILSRLESAVDGLGPVESVSQ